MSFDQQREKLLQAIVFFVKETKNCHKLKLFKLLFFFDFQVFRETGKSATGLKYHAWPMGPVPGALFEELGHPAADLSQRVTLRRASLDDLDFGEKSVLITAKKPFDETQFTRRELRILKNLAEVFLEASGADMREVSHLKGSPWHQVYEVEKRKQDRIPYELALDGSAGSLTKEQAREVESETRELDGLLR